jgi:hypothetical protein
MPTKTLDTRTETTDYFPLFSYEDACDDCEIEEIRKQETITNTCDPTVFYALAKESFFAYAHGETIDDWDKYVKSDPELIKARKAFLAA